MSSINYAKYIDNTLLAPQATEAQIKALCNESRKYNFASVCVNPCFVKLVNRELKNSKVKTCVVIGFPLGTNTTAIKVLEAKDAIKKVCGKKTLKVIIETCLLTDKEKVALCKCIKQAKADFVKTSTGFSTGGATITDIKLLKNAVKNSLLIKASGGIRTREDMIKMIKAGANRIGTSRGAILIKE